MYGDESGGFWFKGLPLDRNPIAALLFILEACLKSKLSPSKLYDKIVEDCLDRKYVFGRLDLIPAQIDSKKLLDFLLEADHLEERKIVDRFLGKTSNNNKDFPLFTAHEYRLEDESKMVMQSNSKNNYIELYVESLNEKNMHEIIGDIQHLIYNDE